MDEHRAGKDAESGTLTLRTQAGVATVEQPGSSSRR